MEHDLHATLREKRSSWNFSQKKKKDKEKKIGKQLMHAKHNLHLRIFSVTRKRDLKRFYSIDSLFH